MKITKSQEEILEAIKGNPLVTVEGFVYRLVDFEITVEPKIFGFGYSNTFTSFTYENPDGKIHTARTTSATHRILTDDRIRRKQVWSDERAFNITDINKDFNERN